MVFNSWFTQDAPASILLCRWYSRKCPIWICDSNTPSNVFLKLRMYHSYISMVRGFLLCIFLISSHCRAASSKGRVRNCNGVITLIKTIAPYLLCSSLAGESGRATCLLGFDGYFMLFALYSLQQNIA